ncbi:MAG: FAD-dependent oxidoreductase [Anaeromyxobacter sp.]
MRIAIVGSGVSGLVAAHHLRREHDVVLYEGGDHVGGHTHTHDVEVGGVRVPVDTGFIVYNEETYPELVRLLAELRVETRASDMSFSVTDERSGREWRATNLDTVFAQRRNLLRPSFWGMLRDIGRFNREARALLREPDRGETVGEFLRRHRFGAAFREHYLVPLGTAVWSADVRRFDAFPIHTFCRFFDNHRFLQVNDQVTWRTVTGGSRRYVDAILAPMQDRVRRAAVQAVRRTPAGVEVLAAGGHADRFDRVVLAAHADEALALLADATPAEREVLSALPYQRNVALLHTDARLMPRNRRAWASWNVRVTGTPRDGATLTYDMNRLQGLVTPEPLLVSLNLEDRVDPSKVLRRMVYHHPIYTPAGVRAQRRHAEIDGAHGVHFAGAYWGYGFHEDGVKSGLEVARRIARAATGLAHEGMAA